MPAAGRPRSARSGRRGFLVNCHLGKHVVEVSAAGVTGRRFRTAPGGRPVGDPNASASDGQGGVYFSDSGIFSVRAPATGRVYHLTAMGVMTEVVSGIKYANGVAFDRGHAHAVRVGASGAAHPGAHPRRPSARHGDAGVRGFRPA